MFETNVDNRLRPCYPLKEKKKLKTVPSPKMGKEQKLGEKKWVCVGVCGCVCIFCFVPQFPFGSQCISLKAQRPHSVFEFRLTKYFIGFLFIK